MSDFAATAMIRLIAAGLKRQGLAFHSSLPTSSRDAVMPLQDKRMALTHLWQTYGGAAIVRIGEAVLELPEEPALIALRLARDPEDLLQRWQKLEQFVHSRHRIRIQPVGACAVRVRHISLKVDQPPTAAEDLLIFGVLAVLIELTGARDVNARLAGDKGLSRQAARWNIVADAPVNTADWQFDWQSDAVQTHGFLPFHSDAQVIAAVRARVLADPGRAWSVQMLMDELKMPRRSLQRHLAAGGASFRELVAQARVAHGARLLGTSRMSAAEIGYSCGFSDQAHFTREFKRSTALTPALYRQKFAQHREK
jgi:AraC-like DNA-binding protein